MTQSEHSCMGGARLETLPNISLHSASYSLAVCPYLYVVHFISVLLFAAEFS